MLRAKNYATHQAINLSKARLSSYIHESYEESRE